MDDDDLRHLERCVELAEQAVAADDEPFGRTQHPEIALARWAAQHLSPQERARATVSRPAGSAPMCAAAHGWVGLGRIVYAHSSQQLAAWLDELGVPPPAVRTLAISEVVRDLPVEGPLPHLAPRLRRT